MNKLIKFFFGIPFVVTLIKDLLPFFYSVEEMFLPSPVVSYRSARKIKDYIVRSKLYPLERNVGGGGCGNGRCQVGKDIKVTDTFDSFTIKKSYKINHKLDKILDLPL